MRSILLPLVAMGATTLAPAQGFQCDLLGTLDNHGPYNDVWGFVGSNGKEYALLLARTGTVVVDCSNPANPVERGWFPWQSSTWRDARVYGDYAYPGTDALSTNVFPELDFSNPDPPSLVGGATAGGVIYAHNIFIDTGTGRLYLAGGNNGTPVFDLSVNPANPTYVGLAAGSGSSNYFHDLCVENGIGYGSMIENGVLRIWDVSTFPPTVLSDTETPSRFTHNAWPNAQGTLCVTTDERAGGVVRFFDVTNKLAPVALGQMTPNGATIPHNAYLVGDICHVSWYTLGYQCIDVKDPKTPILVASYDTYPQNNGGGGSGAWGCYPFQPSGNIYVSDQATGLYIVRPRLTDLTIAHTALADPGDEVGPYAIEAQVTSSHALQSVTLRYRVDGGPLLSLAMTPTGQPDEYAADIPGQDAPAIVEYHIDAVDAQAARRLPRIGEHRFLVGTEVTRWIDDFETSLGWTHGGSGDDWQRGQSSGRAGNSSGDGWQDPVLAASGSVVWGNDIGPTGFNGAYQGSANNFLQSPPIPTNGVQGLRLGYRRHLSLAAGDLARVAVNGVTVFSTTARTDDAYWVDVDHDIAAIANAASTVTVRFELDSANSQVAGGWTIDDVRLFTRHDCVPAVSYGAGTPGTGGVVPALALAGAPVLGGTPVANGSQLLPNSLALLALNTQPADVPALGVQVLVAVPGVVLLDAGISGAGSAAWPIPIPPTPSLDDQYLYLQTFALDGGAPGAFLSASHGLRFRICASAP